MNFDFKTLLIQQLLKTIDFHTNANEFFNQRSHNLGKFPQIFAVSMGVVLGIMRILCIQWRSQPDNLVPLCKFQSIIIIHFFRDLLFSQSVNCEYLHSGTKSPGWLRYCMHSFQNFIVRLIPNHPPPLETRILMEISCESAVFNCVCMHRLCTYLLCVCKSQC